MTEVQETAGTPQIFDGITFTIIQSDKLHDTDFPQIVKTLERLGATYIPTDAEGRIQNLRDINTVISATSDFPEYDAALDEFVAVVKPSWIDQSIAKGRQSNPRQFSPDPALIMSDVVVCCTDIPKGDAEAIAGGVIAMGGQYMEYLSKVVTHLVTLNPDNPMCRMALAKNLKCDILLPHWFDDCLRLGRRIAENPYLFPDPPVLQPDWKGPPVSRQSEEIEGASSYMPSSCPEAVFNPSRSRPLKVFRNMAVMLADDLELSSNRKDAIREVIVASGGKVVNKPNLADIYICQYRDGDGYKLASQKGKTVANLAWLFYVITRDVWTSPMRRLMHYPIPKNGIEGFQNFLISITNYTGEARVYLQFLVQALGANFSKVMKHDNTHLIVAHKGSEKCEAAKEWNIEVVNHLWLEDSYVKCRMQAISNPRYNHFPTRTNLGEVLGQTQLDRDIIERNYYPLPVDEQRRVKTKRGPESRAREDCDLSEDHDEVPAALYEVDDNMNVDGPVPTKVQKAKRAKSDGVLHTPAPRRTSGLDKENDTPGTTGSRGAKDRAMHKLHAAAADIALFNKEMKRVGGVTHGRDRDSFEQKNGANLTLDAPNKGRKRKSDEAGVGDEEDDDSRDSQEPAAAEHKKGKKAKSEKLPPIVHRIMITSYDRWLRKPDAEAHDRNKLRNMGLFVVDRPANACITILCAPKILRTRKFVCALANAPYVVSTNFLDDCLKHNKLASLTKHALGDHDMDAKFDFSLTKALVRAKRNNHALLKGWQIFCTDKIAVGFETYSEIVSVNGGICTLYRGRTNMNVSKRSFDRFTDGDPVAESQRNDSGDTLYLVSGTSREERELWPKFRMQAQRAGMTPVVAHSDWLLSVCMNQEFRWDESWRLA